MKVTKGKYSCSTTIYLLEEYGVGIRAVELSLIRTLVIQIDLALRVNLSRILQN